jgi:lipoic acid synthetase
MNGQRRPAWLKIRFSAGREYRQVREIIEQEGLHTVCRSARCPNMGDCWSRKTATFMILGNICTRNCRFCAVAKGKPSSRPDVGEPQRVADAVKRLALRHAVITSVSRDDLEDGGSQLFVNTIRSIRKNVPGCSIEVLVPDFNGNQLALSSVMKARPDILNHNLEVVPSLYEKVRPKADFSLSLSILEQVKQHGLISKTGIMVGLGESREKLRELLRKLSKIDLDILTIGQYLQPGSQNLPVEKYYHPDEFRELKQYGEALGIGHVESGPMVRSSYHADEQISQLNARAL